MSIGPKKLTSRVGSEPNLYPSSNPFEAMPSTNNSRKNNPFIPNNSRNNNPFIPNSNYLVFPFTLGLKRKPIPLLVLVDSGAIENTIPKSLVYKYDIPMSKDSISGTIECGGRTSNILGITKPIQINFKDESFSIQFLVTDDDSLPPIIGTPWLKSNGAVVDFDCENLYFKKKDVDKNIINKDCNNKNNDVHCNFSCESSFNSTTFSDINSTSNTSNASSHHSNDSSSHSQTHSHNQNDTLNIDISNSYNTLTSSPKVIPPSESFSQRFVIYVSCPSLDKTNTKISVPQIYLDFVEVFSEKAANELPPHRPYDCRIDLKPDSSLPYGPIYSLTVEETQALKEYIKENLKKNFIRKSISPAGAPILFVRKKDGTLRMCIDYRKLNDITIRNSYPLPLINDLLEKVRGAKFFTKLDLRSAYNLVRIKEGDEYKTAFNTRFGHFEYLVMPFGLKNAPATFQHFINDILSDFLDVFAFAYIDDILIFSDNLEDHHKHVRLILERLLKHHLYVKLEKCEFDVTEIDFIGHHLSGSGISMEKNKLETILDWPLPENTKHIQQFMGLCNYYRRFIKDFSKIASPLTRLLKKNIPFEMNNAAISAFNKLKDSFKSAGLLRHADPNKPFIVEADSSNFAIGSVLLQEFDGCLHPVSFHSRALTNAERNYPIYDKELLAIKEAFLTWRHHLEGAKHQITVLSDHRNLLFERKPEHLSQRHIRWSIFFSRFDFIIKFKPGSKNRADCLSRRPDYEQKVVQSGTVLNSSNFLSTTSSISVTDSTLLDKIRSALPNNAYYNSTNNHRRLNLPDSPFTLRDDLLLLYNNRIYIPESLRIDILQSHHNSPTAGHFGISKTFELISRNFWWKSLRGDVRRFVNSCDVCNRNKNVNHKPFGLLQPLAIPEKQWSSISLDFITDLPISNKCSIILTVIDRLSKMGHFIPLEKLPSAEETAKLIFNNIFKLHGIPKEIISDRGKQFNSKFFDQFCKLLRCESRLSTAHHHQTDGQTEKLNDIVEQYLRCFTNSTHSDWYSFLPLAEFAYNNTFQDSIKMSPFQANLQYEPEFLIDNPTISVVPEAERVVSDIKSTLDKLKLNMKEAQEKFKKYADQNRKEAPELNIGDKVWLLYPKGNLKLKKLDPRKSGPFEIIEVMENQNFKLKLPRRDRRYPVFHVSRLEPYVENSFPNRNIEKPPPILVNDELEYEVNDILDSRIVNGVLQYLVDWKGYPMEDRSWENAEDIHAARLVKKFHKKYPNKPHPMSSGIRH